MSELPDWLRRNRPEPLADVFEANDIELNVLLVANLTEEDLDKLEAVKAPLRLKSPSAKTPDTLTSHPCVP